MTPHVHVGRANRRMNVAELSNPVSTITVTKVTVMVVDTAGTTVADYSPFDSRKNSSLFRDLDPGWTTRQAATPSR